MGSSPARRTVSAWWEGGMRAVVTAGRFSVVSDEPPSAGGSDSGPQPTDLFLASVASCYALAVAWAARKRGVVVASLEVRVTGTYEGPRFAELAIEVDSSLPPSTLDALLPEANRVCYVTNTLRVPPRLTIGRATP